MIRNWHKILGYQALLAAAMLAGPARADEDSKKNTDKPGAVDGKAIKEALDRIENKLGSIDSLKSDVGGLKKEIELMRQANSGAFTEFDRRIAQLEERMKGLETRLNHAQTRTANFPPTNGTPAPSGRIRLLNSYPAPARVILNGLVYRLNPFETRIVDVPAGSYTSEVLVDGYGSVQVATTRPIAANETKVIEIYTR
jgi:hypothetical protein